MTEPTTAAVEEVALLPCPFCGSEAEIERRGDHRVSTIYQCTFCGCSLETGEEWSHGRDWNNRAAILALPSVGWRTIDSAPKDGTSVLIAEESRGSSGEAYYDGDNYRWYWANTASGDYPDPHEPYPTHWKPLDPPPQPVEDRP